MMPLRCSCCRYRYGNCSCSLNVLLRCVLVAFITSMRLINFCCCHCRRRCCLIAVLLYGNKSTWAIKAYGYHRYECSIALRSRRYSVYWRSRPFRRLLPKSYCVSLIIFCVLLSSLTTFTLLTPWLELLLRLRS